MNQFNITGNLTADPQLRQTNGPNGERDVVNFTVAVNSRRKGEPALFVSCAAWGALAELMWKYCKRGMKVFVSGEASLNEYTTQSGEKRTNIQIKNVEKFEMLASPNRSAEAPAAEEQKASAKPSELTEVPEPEDLPF